MQHQKCEQNYPHKLGKSKFSYKKTLTGITPLTFLILQEKQIVQYYLVEYISKYLHSSTALIYNHQISQNFHKKSH